MCVIGVIMDVRKGCGDLASRPGSRCTSCGMRLELGSPLTRDCIVQLSPQAKML